MRRCASTADIDADEVSLDAEIGEACDRARSIVRVQRGEHEVAGKARLDRDACGLGVTYLADHDDVGVLTQDVTKARGEGSRPSWCSPGPD